MEEEACSLVYPTRRALREAEQGAKRRPRRKAEPTAGVSPRWVPRAAVLGSLAIATIALPLHAGATDTLPGTPQEPDAQPAAGPSALDVVTQDRPAPGPSAYLAAAAKDLGRAEVASRSATRDPLPGCDETVRPTGTNGNIDKHQLCELFQAGEYLRPDAAVALSALNEAFKANFGRNVCLVSSYRTLSTQVSLKATKGGLAAPPGRSMHGWGLAIDLCSLETGNAEIYKWLNTYGPTYGWANPRWAQRGGSGAFEPWHFEFTKGVKEVGGDWDS